MTSSLVQQDKKDLSKDLETLDTLDGHSFTIQSVFKKHSQKCHILRIEIIKWKAEWNRFGRGPNFKAWTIFLHFQNAGRWDAKRESIAGDDFLSGFCA